MCTLPIYRFWLAVGWCCFLVTANVVAQDWPRLLGPTYDGVAPTPDAQFDFTKPPEHVWTIPVGDGYGLGSIAAGRYLQMDAGQNDGRTIQERIRCFDLATGQMQWEQSQSVEYRDLYGYESGPRGTPATDSDDIFTFGVAGHLNCRSFRDGTLRWSVDTSKEYGVVQNFFGVGSSPLVLGDRVIVMVGGSPAEDARIAPGRLDRVSPAGSALVAFDRATGKELWRCGDDLASYSSPRPMQIDDKTVVLAFARGGLIAVDPERGRVLWRHDHRADILESVNAMVPVVERDRVFISECYDVGSALLQVSLDSAKTIWVDPVGDRRRQAMRVHWSTPVLVGGYLYGCSGRNPPDSDFRCIEIATGKVQWADDRRSRTSVTRVGDALLVLEERGELQVVRLNPERLEVLATWDLTEPSGPRPAIAYPCWAAPIVIGDRVIVRGDTDVLCLRLRTKSESANSK